MEKSKTISFILCCGAFIGLGGLHDFYLKRWKWGIIKLLTVDFFVLGAIIDLIDIMRGEYPVLKERLQEKRNTERKLTPEAQAIADKIVQEAKNNNPRLEFSIGSEKQIDWATRLASEFVKDANELIIGANESGDISEDEANKILDATQKEILCQDDANWWIDNRELNTLKLLKEINKNNNNILELLKKVRY